MEEGIVMNFAKDYLLSKLLNHDGGGGGGDTTYQILSYIQSNGTQAIKLVDSMSEVPRIEVAFAFIADEDFKWILGAEGANNKLFGVQVNAGPSSDNVRVHKSSSKAFTGVKSHKGDLIYCTIDGSVGNLSWYLTSENRSVITGSLNPSFESLSGLYAFGVGRISYETEVSSMITAKLHYIRLDNELFLPAKRVNDGVCGLLNIATHQFLTDCMAGDPFVAGDVIGTIRALVCREEI